MTARIIDSVDTEPAPLRIMLGSEARESTIDNLRKRIAAIETGLIDKIEFVPMDRLDAKTYAEKKKEYQKLFLR